MKISEFLSPADVIVDAGCTNKDQALRELANRAASALGVSADLIASELRKREDLGSTGTGGGVAIPHARVDVVTKPYGVLMRLKRPIEFESMDGKPVDIVFMVLLPAKSSGDLLGPLAAISRTLRSTDTIRSMRKAATSLELAATVLHGGT